MNRSSKRGSEGPRYRRIYGGAIFVDVNPAEQRRRILARCGQGKRAERYFEEWIPMEQRYHAEMFVRENCDVIMDCSD